MRVGHEIRFASFTISSWYYHVIVRPTKIMNRADKIWAHFQKIKCIKDKSFQIISLIEISNWSPTRWTILRTFKSITHVLYCSKKKKKIDDSIQFSLLKNYFENKNFAIFEELVNNSGRPDNNIVNKCLFPVDTFMSSLHKKSWTFSSVGFIKEKFPLLHKDSFKHRLR